MRVTGLQCECLRAWEGVSTKQELKFNPVMESEAGPPGTAGGEA